MIHESCGASRPAAFGKDTLLNPRWFLDGKPKTANYDGVWSDVMVMNATSQYIFIQRVLFVFQVNKRNAGKAQTLRLSLGQWLQEADLCCLGVWVMEKMRAERDDANGIVFAATVLDTVMKNFLDGHLVIYALDLFSHGRKDDRVQFPAPAAGITTTSCGRCWTHWTLGSRPRRCPCGWRTFRRSKQAYLMRRWCRPTRRSILWKLRRKSFSSTLIP